MYDFLLALNSNLIFYLQSFLRYHTYFALVSGCPEHYKNHKFKSALKCRMAIAQQFILIGINSKLECDVIKQKCINIKLIVYW